MPISTMRNVAGAALLLALLSTTAHATGKTFALIQYNQQVSFFTDITKGAQKAAAEAGDKLEVFDANNSAAAQDNAFETYVQQKVDGIIIVPIDPNGIAAAVKAASAAGVPVVAADGVLPPGPQKVQISVDNEKAGYDMGQFYAQYVKTEMGGKASLGILGALNSPLQLLRQKGFEDAIAGDTGITKVGVVDGRNIEEQAMSAGENLLTGNPTMTTIYATGEPALIGAVAAVASQSRTNLKIFGWDLSAQAIAGIDAGTVIGVVQQAPDQEGYKAVQALDTIASGGTVPATIKVPVEIVTKATVDKYRAAYK